MKLAIAFSRVSAFGRSNAGSTAVEFAIAAPILFVLMFAIIEFGRAWWTKSSLQYAVERAVRYAVINNASAAAIKTYAATQVYAQTVGSNAFTVSQPDGATTCVTYSFNYSPWFVGAYEAMSGITTMTGSSCRTHY